ncbi:hypothetical protein [Marmoricola sp. URHB0036]|uniref:hypothetical protein n=1 Tax=Marmoricola sp. URHB0036 TaxID=1298863 RepID=UPI0012DC6ABA|nr:hypothetical protein [Marmoricola sp. URHB0036]
MTLDDCLSLRQGATYLLLLGLEFVNPDRIGEVGVLRLLPSTLQLIQPQPL